MCVGYSNIDKHMSYRIDLDLECSSLLLCGGGVTGGLLSSLLLAGHPYKLS